MHPGRRPLPEGRFSTFRFKSFPTEIHANLLFKKDLWSSAKYFTGHLCNAITVSPQPGQTMTMDERLEKLAERQEALAQSVELLTAGVRELNRPSLSMKSA